MWASAPTEQYIAKELSSLSKTEPASHKKEKKEKSPARWALVIFFVTILISGAISLISEEIMAVSGMAVAFVILLAIIMIGILFDIIGVAVTSADEKPFHSMAARKVPGARNAISLLRNAERVSSICNDVVGDICGVVSGSASATIAAQILHNFDFSWPRIVGLVMSALVAGLTVGGKAVGKTFAIEQSTKIVYTVGRVLFFLSRIPTIFQRNTKKK
jgi:hypothetical protein